MINWFKSSYSTYNGNCVEVAWRKSTRSNSQGACVEVADWRKSARSMDSTNCVEAGNGPGVVGVRDTKQAHLGDARDMLTFPARQWGAFIAGVKQR